MALKIVIYHEDPEVGAWLVCDSISCSPMLKIKKAEADLWINGMTDQEFLDFMKNKEQKAEPIQLKPEHIKWFNP